MYYSYYDYSPYDMRQNTRIISDLEKQSMVNILRSNATKNLPKEQKLLRQKIIQEIRQDEVRHYQLFSKLYYSLTGKTTNQA